MNVDLIVRRKLMKRGEPTLNDTSSDDTLDSEEITVISLNLEKVLMEI